MKRSIICIIIILILGFGLWYYFDGKLKQVEAERDAAIELAIEEAIENSRSRGVVKDPPVRTKIVYVEKEVPAKEKAAPAPKKDPNVFTDERDGKQYKFIEVDGMTWMADNLNYESEESYCYEGNADNCKNWGRLYTWKAASEYCPDGWHLPNNEEWDKLIWAFGGNDVAGKALKVGGTSEFEAMMAGYRDKKNFYGKVDSSAYFWSATEQNSTYASFRGMYKQYSNIGPYTYTKGDAFSVRCVKDN